MKILKLFSKILIAGVFLLLAPNLVAQTNTTTQVLTMTIPQVLLINAVDTTGTVASIALQLNTNIAGNEITGGTGASYAQVSSIIASGQTRTIQASYDVLPAGTSLSVTGVLPNSGDGNGTYGTAVSSVTLSTSAQDIFTGIGSCYTGTASKDGYRLNWQWNAVGGSYSSIVATGGTSTTVTLTITAGS